MRLDPDSTPPAARLLPGLDERVREPEIMDDPTLDPLLHRQALTALERVNRVSLGDRRAMDEVRRLVRTLPGPVRVLDVACGGADVLVAIGRAARRSGLAVELHGCDLSPVALDHGRARARAAGVEVAFTKLDVLADTLPSGHDLVLNSLFLHHLSAGDAATLLRKMADAAGRALFVQDLLRTRVGFALAFLGLHTLTRSPVARVDGLRSVRAAFSEQEARALCVRAGLGDAMFSRCWPERFAIRWEAS